jgi:hypothetical protein
VQDIFAVPPGRLTEGTLETGHQVSKRNQNCFAWFVHVFHISLLIFPSIGAIIKIYFRNFSYKAALIDIMVRGQWSSDALLLWEKVVGQEIKPGYLKKRREDLKRLEEEGRLAELLVTKEVELEVPESK